MLDSSGFIAICQTVGERITCVIIDPLYMLRGTIVIRKLFSFTKGLLLDDPAKVHPIHRDNPRAYFRVCRLWRIVSLVGASSHLLLLFVFFAIGIREMVFFNLLSVAIWIGGIVLLRQGRFYLVYCFELFEVIAHGVAATYFLGHETGFIYHLILVPLVGLINPVKLHPVDITSKLIFTIASVVAFLLSWNNSFSNGAAYSLANETILSLQVFNLILVTLTIMMIGGLFSFMVKNAEDSLEREYKRSESLLLNVLPPSIAERLKGDEKTIADRFVRTSPPQ